MADTVLVDVTPAGPRPAVDPAEQRRADLIHDLASELGPRFGLELSLELPIRLLTMRALRQVLDLQERAVYAQAGAVARRRRFEEHARTCRACVRQRGPCSVVETVRREIAVSEKQAEAAMRRLATI